MLRIAVQAKGRLFEETMALLEESDIKLSTTKRTLLVQSSNFPIEVLFLRDDDIPQTVATGVADLGIVGENELVEKEEDALAFIEEMKKKYWDARHNCYAYSIGEHREFTRCSDDGEPSGTAGRPMLDVILGEDIYNVAVVVTRYFGGVLLGTGGLVRAYSGAVQAGLGESTVIEKHHGISLALTADYTAIGKLQYIAAENQLPVLDTEYTDKVIMHLLVPNDQIGRIQKVITEATSGRIKMDKEKELYFADVEGKIKVFDH